MKALQFAEMLKKPKISSIEKVLKFGFEFYITHLQFLRFINFTFFHFLEFCFQIKGRFGKTDVKFSK